MTQEQKAQAYDEALERAKTILKRGYYISGDIEVIFPELADSEDEKIKKAIHIYLDWLDGRKDYAPKGEYSIRDMIDWLEKQGERKPTSNIRYEVGDDDSLSVINGKPFDYEHATIQQKDFASTEPKFKVGDWVMLDRPVLITKVEDMPYNTHQYWTSDGTWFGDATKAKLWTIQDARDGDVLVADDMIVLFKKRLENGSILTYFHYDTIDNEYEPGCHLYYAHIYPATKEQCDTLIKVMANAGYTFDFEKKELKKIELKPTIEMKTPEESLGIDSETYNKIVDECIYGEQKSAWSEEDEIGLSDALWAIKQARTIAKDENDMGNLWYAERWLKSLKERHTWKPSDELLDIFIKNATDFFESNFNPLTDGGVIGVFDDKEKMIEEFKEYMKEEGFNEEWI